MLNIEVGGLLRGRAGFLVRVSNRGAPPLASPAPGRIKTADTYGDHPSDPTARKFYVGGGKTG